jgi:hypothetical protein
VYGIKNISQFLQLYINNRPVIYYKNVPTLEVTEIVSMIVIRVSAINSSEIVHSYYYHISQFFFVLV